LLEPAKSFQILIEEPSVMSLALSHVPSEIKVPLGKANVSHPGFSFSKSIEPVSGPAIVSRIFDDIGSNGIGVDVEHGGHFVMGIGQKTSSWPVLSDFSAPSA
jgi:hypothetical protein